MNNKQYELLMENWRSYINQGEINEGIKETIVNFAKGKLSSLLQQFTDSLKKEAAQITPQQFTELANVSPDVKSIGQDMAKVKTNLESDISQLKTKTLSEGRLVIKDLTTEDINSLLEEIEKKEKQIEEFGIAGILGAGLGALGLGIMIVKGLLLIANKLGFEGSGLKTTLTVLEQIEQKIKNFLSSLKVLDAAGYQILKLLLKWAKANPGGFFHKYFTKSGIKIYLAPEKELPPLKLILNPNFRANNHDVEHHVEHEADYNFFLRNPEAYKAKKGEEKYNKYKEKLKEKDPKKYNKLFGPRNATSPESTQSMMNTRMGLQEVSGGSGDDRLTRPNRKRMAKEAGLDSIITPEEAKEIKELVAINQKLVFMCILGGFMAYGIHTLVHHGIHGIAGAVEVGATATKGVETAQAVAGIAAKGIG